MNREDKYRYFFTNKKQKDRHDKRKYSFAKRDMEFIVEGLELLYGQTLTDWTKIDNVWLKEMAFELNGDVYDLKSILEDDRDNWENKDE